MVGAKTYMQVALREQDWRPLLQDTSRGFVESRSRTKSSLGRGSKCFGSSVHFLFFSGERAQDYHLNTPKLHTSMDFYLIVFTLLPKCVLIV